MDRTKFEVYFRFLGDEKRNVWKIVTNYVPLARSMCNNAIDRLRFAIIMVRNSVESFSIYLLNDCRN